MKFQIARNGEEVGAFTLAELKKAIKAGTVLREDFAWTEGWAEWKPVGDVEGIPKAKAPPAPKAPPQPQPATEKQVKYIESFGEQVKPGLTKEDASAMLDRLTQDPKAKERQNQINAERFRMETLDREAHPSFYYRIEIESAQASLDYEIKEAEKYAEERKGLKEQVDKMKAELAATREALAKATDPAQVEEWKEEVENVKEQLASAEEELAENIQAEKDTKENLPDYKDDLKLAVKNRIEFWKDAFRELPQEYSAAQEKLYAGWGRFLKMPTNKEVADILAALDAQLPGWDKGHDSFFFATYTSTFTDRAKKSAEKATRPPKAQKAAKQGKGCLVMVAAFALPGVGGLIVGKLLL